MKTLIRNLVFSCALIAAPAWAGMIFTLDPPNGIVGGSAGETVGWGVTFTTDDNHYYVPTFVEFCIGAAFANTGSCNSTAAGEFTDFAASVNQLIIGPLFNPSGYSELFDEFGQTGLGSFAISPSALSQTLAGTIYIYYDVYQGNPFDGAEQLPSGTYSQFAQVNVDRDEILPGPGQGPGPGTVPEPGSILLFGAGLATMWWRAKRT